MNLRRGAHLAVLTVLVAAGAAAAGPVPESLHESTSAVAVPRGIRAVVVDLDSGDVTLGVGTPKGSAHKRWNLQEPRLTVTERSGTLRVVGRCDEDRAALPGGASVTTVGWCRIDLSLTVPAGVAVDVTGDAVSVSGTRGPVRVRASRSATISRVGPGAVDAVSDSSTLTLRDSTPATTVLRSSNALALTGLRTRSLSAVSDASTVTLSDVRAGQVVARASNALTAKQATVSSLSATSDASTVTLADVVSTGEVAVRASNAVRLDRVTAAGASLTSDASTVSVTATRLAGRLTAQASNALSLDGLTATGADLESTSSTISVRRSPLRALTGTASNAVSVDLPVVPDRVRLVSDSSTIAVRVPRSSYAVVAQSDSGRVSVRGIVIDDRAARTLTLRASGDITVN